ncbi:unnamed protein product [Paramecium octaurelia]|uniref:Uncharacterized protein n=1 Tax=Paramecium octaurelia TaxID=43137 RepID=A0A8S1TIK1_PAROT|nr:unnamed protein product [Paramecium octaurelia]
MRHQKLHCQYPERIHPLFQSPQDSFLRNKFLRFPFQNDSPTSCCQMPRINNSDQRLIFLRAPFLNIRPITKMEESTADQSKIHPLPLYLIDRTLLSPKIFLNYLMQRQFPFNFQRELFPYTLRAKQDYFFLNTNFDVITKSNKNSFQEPKESFERLCQQCRCLFVILVLFLTTRKSFIFLEYQIEVPPSFNFLKTPIDQMRPLFLNIRF